MGGTIESITCCKGNMDDTSKANMNVMNEENGSKESI